MTDQTAAPVDPMTRPESWNAVAVAYDEELFHLTPEFAAEAMAILDPPSSATVLDVGTGPGNIAVRLARRVSRVVAIDFAETMIERLRGHLEREGIRNVEAHVMDGHALTLPDASFDAVVSMFGWFLFADRARGLAEMHRVLREGGRVLVTSWATIDKNRVIGAGMEAIRAVLPDLPRPTGPLPTQLPDVCAAELRQAGFRDVTARSVAASTSFGSVDEYWRMLERASAPLVVIRKKIGDTAFRTVAERAVAFLREQHGRGALVLPVEAIFTSGTR